GIWEYRGARNSTRCSVRQLRVAQGTSRSANPAAISAPARRSFGQSTGRRQRTTSTSATATSISGVSGRTSAPSPTIAPPRNQFGYTIAERSTESGSISSPAAAWRKEIDPDSVERSAMVYPNWFLGGAIVG